MLRCAFFSGTCGMMHTARRMLHGVCYAAYTVTCVSCGVRPDVCVWRTYLGPALVLILFLNTPFLCREVHTCPRATSLGDHWRLHYFCLRRRMQTPEAWNDSGKQNEESDVGTLTTYRGVKAEAGGRNKQKTKNRSEKGEKGHASDIYMERRSSRKRR